MSFQPSLYGQTVDEYDRNTLLVQNREDVPKYISYYLWKLEERRTPVHAKVYSFLSCLLSDEVLLRKTWIVSLLSWRNGVISIRPNDISWDSAHTDVLQVLESYRFREDVFYLYMHEKPLQRFLNSSVGMAAEQENLQLFQRIRDRWREDYERLRRKKVDELLDCYNSCLDKAEAELIMKKIRSF